MLKTGTFTLREEKDSYAGYCDLTEPGQDLVKKIITKEITGNILVDMDEDQNLLGIEFLFDVPRS